MTQHYFALFYDTEDGKFHRDDEVSINFDSGKIWDPITETWCYAFEEDELENADEKASATLSELLERQ